MLPRLHDLPIPADCVADDTWSPVLRDLADHIGGYAALSIAEAFGGRQIYVPMAAARNPFRSVLTDAQVKIVANVFGGTRLDMPTGRATIARTRRAAVIAAVRAGSISAADATIILGTGRRYVQQLLRETDEGVGVTPIVLPQNRDCAALLRAADAIGVVLTDAGIAPDLIATSKARLLASASNVAAWSHV